MRRVTAWPSPQAPASSTGVVAGSPMDRRSPEKHVDVGAHASQTLERAGLRERDFEPAAVRILRGRIAQRWSPGSPPGWIRPSRTHTGGGIEAPKFASKAVSMRPVGVSGHMRASGMKANRAHQVFDIQDLPPRRQCVWEYPVLHPPGGAANWERQSRANLQPLHRQRR